MAEPRIELIERVTNKLKTMLASTEATRVETYEILLRVLATTLASKPEHEIEDTLRVFVKKTMDMWDMYVVNGINTVPLENKD